MKRRTFLLAGLGTGGALFLGWALLPARQRLVGSTRPDTGGTAVALNGWLTIAPDDTITVVVPKAEMGQGTHTALAMLLAEELECDWARVREIGDSGALLVRPDQHVAWRGNTVPDDSFALIDRLRGAEAPA